MKEFRQTIFGEGGNCFATCVAMILNLSIEEVPNFVVEEDWWENFQKWLVERNMFAIEIDSKGGMRPLPTGVHAILTGPADRGLSHSVIGEYAGTNEEGLLMWNFKYDPHPDNTFISKIEFACFIVKEIVGRRGA